GVDPLVALGPAFLGARPGAVRVLRLHEAARAVVDVAVVVGAIDEEAVIRLPARGSRDLRDRIIVVGVLERFRGRLRGLVDRDVAELLVVGEAGAGLIGDTRLAVVPVARGIALRR